MRVEGCLCQACTRCRWEPVLLQISAAVIQDAAEPGEVPPLVAGGRRDVGTVRCLVLGSISTEVMRSVAGPALIVPPCRRVTLMGCYDVGHAPVRAATDRAAVRRRRPDPSQAKGARYPPPRNAEHDCEG